MSPAEQAGALGDRARALRLARNLTQSGLAARAGVSLSSLKRFERTGDIRLSSLLRIAGALDALPAFDALFAEPEFRALDDVLARRPERRRGRRR